MYKMMRAPKTLAELREAANPEAAGMIRAKRKTLPTYWDDLYRATRSKPRYKDKRESWGRI
jgi:hypothetical protein